MKETLIIRADADSGMGTGHVMRCLALGQAWQDSGGAVVFIGCCSAKVLWERLENEGFITVKLGCSYPDSDADLNAVLRLADYYDVKWVAIDGYQFDILYQKSIHSAGYRLLCIDDYNHLPKYEADLLLNQNIGSDELGYDVDASCRLLLGSEYVLFRREFRNVNLDKALYSNGKISILVSMGGSDPDNASLAVLEGLASCLDERFSLSVLVGAANRYSDKLSQWIAQSSIQVELLKSVKDMPDLLLRTDYAISAAGSTCWELVAMQVPFVSVILADNQVYIAEQLFERLKVPSAGWVDKGFIDRLRRIVSADLKDHSFRARSCVCSVNLQGAVNVVSAMREGSWA